ncbi:MAG: enoyl-CoA hydratase/isomerase family protein [Thermoanaerobaculia bacterium]|nr:enoyl-CoA hydratase/isomerase family protein [Thermoanaerobaculia bacterium]
MPLIVSQTHGPVTSITLNRPDKLNAFGGTMREELLDTLQSAAADAACRALVITGAGRAFCAGGDLDYMDGLQQQGDIAGFRRLLEAGREIVLAIAEMPKPVIAAINGVAAGAGCNLALACDYRIASDQAKLGETFVKIGIHPDWGGTWLLPRLVGRSRSLELMMSGRIIDASEALAIGMVDRVVAAADLLAETMKLADTFAAGPPIAIAGIKRALALSERNDLRSQIELESEHQVQAFRSKDATEGMAAFLGKREARFRGE